MDLFTIAASITLDTTEYEKNLKSAASESKTVKSAMESLVTPVDKIKSAFSAITHPVESVKSSFDKVASAAQSFLHPIETMKGKISEASTALETKRNKLSALSAAYDSSKAKVASLTEEFNKSVKESGASSEKTQELARKLREAEAASEQAKGDLDAYAASVKKTGKETDGAAQKTSGFADVIKNGLATAAKAGAAAITAATAAVGALAKIGVDYNSQMEQYTTNFTTMLGSQEAAVQKVDELKKFAASTPLSMADLADGTKTLLAFGVASEDSTGILRQLGDIALGDADKMKRLATAFGKATAQGKVTGDTVQQMIDAGWNPLIEISKATGESMEEVQKRMSDGKVSVEELEAAMETATSAGGQFAGGMEAASKTFAGQMSTLKDNAMSLVGEVFQPISDELSGTILPLAIESIGKISEAFQEGGISGAIGAFGTALSDGLNMLIEQLPSVVDAGMQLMGALGQGLLDNLPTIIDAAVEIVESLINGMVEALPQIVESTVEIIASLASGISKFLPELLPTIVEVVMQIVETLIDNVDMLIDAAIEIIIALAEGLISALPKLLEKAPEIVAKLVDAVIRNAPKLLNAATKLIFSLVDGIIDNLPNIAKSALQIVDTVKNTILELPKMALSWGKDLIDNFVQGIKNTIGKVTNAVSSVASTVKNFIGFSEPEKGPLSNFHTYAPDMMKLFAQGIRDNENLITDQIEKSFDFGERTIGVSASYIGQKNSPQGNQFGSGLGLSPINITINGARYNDERSLAKAVAEELQSMMERRNAIYA